jgi:hypothetical protein
MASFAFSGEKAKTGWRLATGANLDTAAKRKFARIDKVGANRTLKMATNWV